MANVQFVLDESPYDCQLHELFARDADSKRPLSGAELFRALASDRRAAQRLVDVLRSARLPDAVFFEVRPYTHNTLNERFEAVLHPAPAFAGRKEDGTTFADKFTGNELLAVFPSLGTGNSAATLIVPALWPKRRKGTYVHLLDFMRHAPADLRVGLIMRVAREYLSALEREEDTPLWLSTSGLGVNHVHVRIDWTPKYYTTERYKVHAPHVPDRISSDELNA